MAHASVKVYIHFVWTTKNRKPLLRGDARKHSRNHIEEYAGTNGIVLHAIAMRPEHAHLLVDLGRSQRIEDVAKLLKGESSHWINLNNLIAPKFSWQTGYWAGSVSYQHLDVVKRYVETQDEHHRVKTFGEEFEALLREYGYTDDEIAGLLRLESR